MNRRQFFGSIAITMKRILIENARYNSNKGRENKFTAVEFEEELYLDEETSAQIVSLNEALEELTAKRPELAEIVNLKFFVGLEIFGSHIRSGVDFTKLIVALKIIIWVVLKLLYDFWPQIGV